MAALIVLAVVVVLLILLLSCDPGGAGVRAGCDLPARSPQVSAEGTGPLPLIPIIDKMVRVDLRTVTLNVPPQEVITKDNVPVRVNAVAYFRIIDPEGDRAGRGLHGRDLADRTTTPERARPAFARRALSERDKINEILQRIIDEATSPWGVKVSIVEVKDVEIPAGMQRAMARQAEAERERRAKVIAPRASSRRLSA